MYPYDEILSKVEKIEENGQSLKDFVVQSTCGDKRHKMILEEDYASIGELSAIYEDMHELERADLYDYQNIIGRYDREF